MSPARRSTPCTHTSLARIHGTSVAGIVRPCALRTSAVHAPGGIVSIATASRAQAAA